MIFSASFVGLAFFLLSSKHPGATRRRFLPGVFTVVAVAPSPPHQPYSSSSSTLPPSAPSPPPSGVRASASAGRAWIPSVRGIRRLRFIWNRPVGGRSGPSEAFWPPPAPKLEPEPWATIDVVGGDGQQQFWGILNSAGWWKRHSDGAVVQHVVPNPEQQDPSNPPSNEGGGTHEESQKLKDVPQQTGGVGSRGNVVNAAAAHQERIREKTLRKRYLDMQHMAVRDRRFRYGLRCATVALFVVAFFCAYMWRRRSSGRLRGAQLEITVSRVPRETQTDMDFSLDDLSIPSSTAE